MKSIYLDTNIVLDILDSQRENHHLTKQLLTKIVNEEYSVVISEDMLSIIYYIIKNKQAVLNFFRLILKEWNVVAFEEDTISTAIDLCLKTPNQDFEDTLQCLCAKKEGCEFLISRDASFVDCGVPVITIEEFLTL